MSIPITHLSYQIDPYTKYARLCQQADFVWDDAAQAWIVSRADHVSAVLADARCAVRPVHEAVPKALQGSAAGEIFSHLIRMNEAEAHRVGKASLMLSLGTLDLSQVQESVIAISNEIGLPDRTGAALNQWVYQLPVRCMALLMGFDLITTTLIAQEIADFVACLSALSSEEELQQASRAAEVLRARMQNHLRASIVNDATPTHSFLHSLQFAAKAEGWIGNDAIVANLVGLLSQSYEATAGLLANTVIQLHQQTTWRNQLQREIGSSNDSSPLLQQFVREVARFDPAIHSTRRFVTQDCSIGGQELRSGQTIILLLAAANRDNTQVADADCFNPQRHALPQWGFSAGHHACPGQQLAFAIVEQAVLRLLRIWSEEQWRNLSWEYQTSLNARLAKFK